MHNHDLVSDGFLTLTAASLVLLGSSLLAFAFNWADNFGRSRASQPIADGLDCASPRMYHFRALPFVSLPPVRS